MKYLHVWNETQNQKTICKSNFTKIIVQRIFLKTFIQPF